MPCWRRGASKRWESTAAGCPVSSSTIRRSAARNSKLAKRAVWAAHLRIPVRLAATAPELSGTSVLQTSIRSLGRQYSSEARKRQSGTVEPNITPYPDHTSTLRSRRLIPSPSGSTLAFGSTGQLGPLLRRLRNRIVALRHNEGESDSFPFAKREEGITRDSTGWRRRVPPVECR